MVKSDVYSLGIVMLQMLTGRTSPLGLAASLTPRRLHWKTAATPVCDRMRVAAGRGATASRAAAPVRRDAVQRQPRLHVKGRRC
ncbi:hypothetical protein QYE76_007955 [Lolium multiflorum]|uniref:Uncharacterized protein n=1 Tax=Lolium multiflorum TaxID=4521 RepID=A0AAD8VDA7_LOLMU|nr:hypothetical protein QYE76_007955 [Lolium multiflorum]